MGNDLDREGDLHVYEQIAKHIADRIRSGDLEPGRPIPSETTIMQMYEEYGVARTTVRRAIARLRDLGIVRTVPGRGSFVTDKEAWPAKWPWE